MTHRERQTYHQLIKLIRRHLRSPKRGIELGIYEGESMLAMMTAFPNLHMWGVDPWQSEESKDSRLYAWAEHRRKRRRMTVEEISETMGYTRHIYKTDDQHHESRAKAFKTLDGLIGSRATIIEMSSEDAVHELRGRTYDFVYIDGDHSRCGKDIRLYWPLVRHGGLMVGHDYGSKLNRMEIWDVNSSVDGFTARNNLELIEGRFHLWAVKKPQLQT